MASIHPDPRTGNFLIMFRYGGKQCRKSLKTKDEAEARALQGRIELTLLELERGRRDLPAGADVWEFLQSDGRRSQKVTAPAVVTLDELFARYGSEMPPDALAQSTLDTITIHKRHLLRILGRRSSVSALSPSDIQKYVTKRRAEKYRKKLITAKTARKELVTLRAVWNWGKAVGFLTGEFPNQGVIYGKDDEKPPFATWGEIESRIRRDGLTDRQVRELWNSLFLDVSQIKACLEHVRDSAALPFVYPMFVFVAHTGARRSELLRSQVDDFNFVDRRVRLREKKRRKDKNESNRFVEMSATLARVMKDWFANGHPGGQFTLCHSEFVGRSRKRSRSTGHQSGPLRATTVSGRANTVHERTERPPHAPLTNNEATHFFKQALAGSKWEVVKGFHVFRHSIASNLAAEGVRQDVVDAWLGHQTEEMRRRYRHLFPKEKRDAVDRLFGE